MAKKANPRNVHFRQTAKSFRADKQTQIYSHINRSLPYKLYKKGKKEFVKKVRQAKNRVGKNTLNLLKRRKK